MGRWLSVAALLAAAWGCDDAGDGGGDAPCPEGTVRSGNECLPDPNRDDGDVDDDMGDTDQGMADATPDSGSGELTLPLIIDEHYAPSGFMGDGEVGGILSDNACAMRAGEEGGLCHRFVYTPVDRGFAGVFWQYPDGNWGDMPGLAVPAGATRVQFYAWGEAGGEQVTFLTGYGETDGFAVERTFVELTDAPALITLDLAGVPYSEIAGGLAWFMEAGGTFYMDDLRIVNDPSDTVDPCTVSCATLQGLGECEGKVGYSACKEQCAARQGGECAAETNAWLTCVGDGGWVCNAGNAAPANGCATERDALEACEGDAPPTPLPFYIEEHFTMSGYMGGGDVNAEPCADNADNGACLRITWTPGEAEWVGFFFQHPENNWGELPGLRIADGATHIRFRAWGETGTERANFAAGIADADSFNIETGYMALGTEPTDGVISLPPGIDAVRGGFAWFLEANGAETVTFYLDDVQWRNDEPPGGVRGCTDETASNYNQNAVMDDGSCTYRVDFSVDMNCTEDPFETVFITGPFCEWCAEGFELTDEDNDGVYTGGWDFPAGDLEFKFMVDNFAGQEDLIDDVAAGNGACAPVTDGSTFANRQIEIAGPQVVEAAYGQCQACGEEPPPPDLVDVTFRVDMNCTEDPFETVFITGPFCEWCDGGFPLVDLDEDGIWEATYAFPAGPLEYKYMVDNFAGQENLIDDVQAGNGDCAPITDGANFANRQAQIMGPGPMVLEAAYGQCQACGDEPPPPNDDPFETITFDDPEVAYALIGFGGAEDSAVEVDPTDDANMVARITKSDAAELWAGVTIATRANDGAGAIPFDAENVQMTVRFWSPHAGIQVRLKVENSLDPAVSVETEATSTVAAGWEELTFDFSRQAEGTAAINFDATYDKVSLFPNFGVTGADAGARTYYVDDVAFIGGVGEPPPSPNDDPFETITFDDAELVYTLTGFGGAEDSAVEMDPTDDANMVARITKSDAAELWAGVTISTRENQSAGAIPFDAENTQMTVRIWSPHAGIPVRLKVEDSTDPTISVETEAMVTVAAGWEELTFDFGQQAEGTAAINFDATYDKVSLFPNFGTPGADAGARTYYVDDVAFAGGVGEPPPPDDMFDITFEVDMNCTEDPYETVFITGPFCQWCADGFQLLDEDGDGIFSGTFAFPAGPLEYKYMVNNFAGQENLVDDVMAGNGACAPVTDGANFANRQFEVAANATRNEVYGQCDACDDEPPPPVDGAFETITFDDAELIYTLTGFGGAEDAAVEADPEDANNMVARIIKNDAAELWAGVTISTRENQGAGAIPFDAENTQMTVRFWSPDAGIPVRLKVENSVDPAVSVETEAMVTVAAGWEELTFDFSQQADGTAAINFDATYDKVSLFPNFGTTGAEAGAQTYYVDDVAFVGGVGEPPPPDDMFDITFEVDMNCTEDPYETVFITGPFCEWCADGFQLLDEDGDGVYSGTFAFPAGPLEYKYMVNNFAGQENLVDDVMAGNGACAPVTDGANFANRQFEVVAAATRSEVYGQCDACADEPPPDLGFETITFDDAEVMYGLAGFGGAEDAAVEVDPTDENNMVARILKNDAAELWAGVTISTRENQGAGAIPFDAENVRMTVRFWSPDAGIPVRLKVENSLDPAVSVETEAMVTVAAGWEELTFDFSQQADGTAAINFDATYDKVSIFPNFGTTGAEAGAQTYYVDDVAFVGGVGEPPPPDDMFDITFEVNMNCTEDPYETVFITGPFCEWCADGFQLLDEDGDGIFSGTFAFPAGPLEYKYMVNNFAGQENLVDDVMAGNGACAPVTDGANFANRQFDVVAAATRSEVYGQCDACADEPPPDLGFETITFDDAEVMYGLAGFGGAEDAAVEVDPTDENNMVARILKNDAAEVWAGVTISTRANNAIEQIPFDAQNVRMTVRFWSPDAGIPVRLKVENSLDPAVSVEAEAMVTVAAGWEELTFDFSQQADGTAAINFGNTYDKVSIFPNFGTPGAEAGAKTYYVDDVAFVGGAEEPPPPGEAILAFDFEDVGQIEDWEGVADANSIEASIGWADGRGNPGGAIELTSRNTEDRGKSYIFQYSTDGVDYLGANSVLVSFDARLSAPLVGVALHLQTNLPGVGVTNTFNIEARGLNDAGWTRVEVEIHGVDPAADAFSMHLNMATGAFVDAGGAVLIDNIRVEPLAD